MKQKDLIARAREITGRFSLGGELSAGTVGSALVTKKGNVYTGICIDIYCGIGFCAEHAAIAEMLKHRETEIEMIVAVTADKILPPCGRCREIMYQVNGKNLRTKVIVSEKKAMALEELLPLRWQEA
jgi:cytidine deaminase